MAQEIFLFLLLVAIILYAIAISRLYNYFYAHKNNHSLYGGGGFIVARVFYLF